MGVTKLDPMDDFLNFVAKRAEPVIGDGMLGSAIILFEFINEDGRLCYSVLRPNGVSWPETAELLLNASDTFAHTISEGHFPEDIDIEDDDDLGYDDDIDYK
jgi:hypothetical protein